VKFFSLLYCSHFKYSFTYCKDTIKRVKSQIYLSFFDASIFDKVKRYKNLSKRAEKELVSFLEREGFIQ